MFQVQHVTILFGEEVLRWGQHGNTRPNRSQSGGQIMKLGSALRMSDVCHDFLWIGGQCLVILGISYDWVTFDIGRCLKIAIPTLASIKNPQLFGTLLVKTIEPIHIYSPIDIHLSAFYRKKRKLMETGYNKIYIYYICTYIYIYYINYIYIYIY